MHPIVAYPSNPALAPTDALLFMKLQYPFSQRPDRLVSIRVQVVIHVRQPSADTNML